METNNTNKGLITCEDGRIRPAWATTSDLLKSYYDNEWGKPLTSENEAFERLALEGFQAGLSWEIVLKKREALREAFAHFDVDTVAEFDDEDVSRLLVNPAIIRNASKITAVIHNARCVQSLRDEGGLVAFLHSFAPEVWEPPQSVSTAAKTSPESSAMAKELKRRGFEFVGPTTCFALMEATGIVNNRVVGSSDLK
ncbi:DNA-3-methyladenine glycosylase I [Corynebacterium hindlerae]|uniref:DNA-3-methyladenine glycosylase I n=1 Tax=Corynebacterium hindlerae TaxID=699041 RepID=UPI001AD78798|nr:DNA-3-methyladenine glycosylase I [Corynebacterium hindlerae]QTH59733.1 DNA-3-methyladenine glycosylase I [Corynebacterium hindlerae]